MSSDTMVMNCGCVWDDGECLKECKWHTTTPLKKGRHTTPSNAPGQLLKSTNSYRISNSVSPGMFRTWLTPLVLLGVLVGLALVVWRVL